MPRPNRFLDAWRENRIGPAWWSLLTWLRSTVRDAQPGWWARQRFRVRELAHRLRLSGLAWPALAVTVGSAAGLAAFARWAQPDRRLDVADAVSWAVPALTALVALVGAGGLAANRWLTWRTPAGARLFQRRDDNPMETVAAHADWLRRQVDAPVVLVIDDLDRCDAAFTVELLEAVETVVRRPPTHGRAGTAPAQPLVVLVCADERWIHAAFETIYAPFTAAVRRSGTTLGSLFLAKLFPLRLRVPDLDVATAVVFARAKLGLPVPDARTGGPVAPGGGPPAAGAVDAPATPIDTRLDEVRRTDDPDLARARLRELSRRSASVEGQRSLRHELEDFLPLLEPQPRAVVRLINAYTILRLTTGGSGAGVRPGALARWVILGMRWPALADALVERPELVDAWAAREVDDGDPGAALVLSDAVRAVLGVGRPDQLTATAVRHCLGVAAPGVGGRAAPGPVAAAPAPADPGPRVQGRFTGGGPDHLAGVPVETGVTAGS
jgi:hypothetical protein